MGKKRYTREQMGGLLEYYGSDAELARHLGISRQSVNQQRRRLNVPLSKTRILIRNAKIIQFYNKKAKIKDIAEEMELSTRQVARIIHQGVNGNET